MKVGTIQQAWKLRSTQNCGSYI